DGPSSPTPRATGLGTSEAGRVRLSRVDVDLGTKADEPEGQVDHPRYRLLQFLVPCRHPAELLELGDQPLHTVPLSVSVAVQWLGVDPVRLRRDHRLGPDRRARTPLRRALERLVTDHLVDFA